MNRSRRRDGCFNFNSMVLLSSSRGDVVVLGDVVVRRLEMLLHRMNIWFGSSFSARSIVLDLFLFPAPINQRRPLNWISVLGIDNIMKESWGGGGWMDRSEVKMKSSCCELLLLLLVVVVVVCRAFSPHLSRGMYDR